MLKAVATVLRPKFSSWHHFGLEDFTSLLSVLLSVDCPSIGMSAQELSEENDELTEQIKEYRRRTAMLRLLLEELAQSYEDSKRFIVVQRYRLIKSMIKRVTQSSLMWVNSVWPSLRDTWYIEYRFA